MRLVKLTVENFRCYRTPFTLDLDDMTALIGQNDVGKSALMDALAIFFGEAKLDREDGCKLGDPSSVRITCEFDTLPDEVILDADFRTNLLREYMLNEAGNLELQKSYNGALVTPKETGIVAIAMHPSAAGYNDLHSLKRPELVARANELGVDMTGVPQNINAPMRGAIWAHCPNLEPQRTEIPLDADGGKQIFSAVAPFLPAFALFKSDRASTDQDDEAQDPLKAAISEAIRAVEDKLQEVKTHVEAEVRKIAEATKLKLAEMDPSIAETLNPVVTTKKWDSLFQTSITGDEGVPLNKRGSGVKRLVLLNFFRAQAEKHAFEQKSPSVIYAVEEPETSQHPRNQRLLLSALRELASNQGRQVIVTTHTPMLARCLSSDTLRFLERAQDGTRTVSLVDDQSIMRVAQSLGVLPDHNVKAFIGVEGTHDITFLKGMSRMLLAAGEDVPDLDALELKGELIFFPFGGSNLAIWASRLKGLNRPEYHICDRDVEPPHPPKYSGYMAEVNARDACTAVATAKREMENYLHHDAVREAYQKNGLALGAMPAFADFDDVPMLVARAVHTATSETPWDELPPEKHGSKMKTAKRQLNGVVVDQMNPARLDASDPNNEVRGWLAGIADLIQQAQH